MRTQGPSHGSPVRVVQACDADYGSWLRLAAEVEPVFGPMASDPGFHHALRRNIERGTAFCVRDHDGPPGCSLIGAMLVANKPDGLVVGWLAVARQWRRHGVGRALLEHVLPAAGPAAEASATTFAASDPDGAPARSFYERMGFAPAEMGAVNPAGRSTQVFRRRRRA